MTYLDPTTLPPPRPLFRCACAQSGCGMCLALPDDGDPCIYCLPVKERKA